jgi:hypothetical protein
MTIQVCSYTADYPIKDQPDWGKIYNTLQEAIIAARFAYSTLTRYEDRYTAIEVIKDDAIVTIFVIWRGQEAYGKEAGLLSLILSEERTTVYEDYEAA